MSGQPVSGSSIRPRHPAGRRHHADLAGAERRLRVGLVAVLGRAGRLVEQRLHGLETLDRLGRATARRSTRRRPRRRGRRRRSRRRSTPLRQSWPGNQKPEKLAGSGLACLEVDRGLDELLHRGRHLEAGLLEEVLAVEDVLRAGVVGHGVRLAVDGAAPRRSPGSRSSPPEVVELVGEVGERAGRGERRRPGCCRPRPRRGSRTRWTATVVSFSTRPSHCCSSMVSVEPGFCVLEGRLEPVAGLLRGVRAVEPDPDVGRARDRRPRRRRRPSSSRRTRRAPSRRALRRPRCGRVPSDAHRWCLSLDCAVASQSGDGARVLTRRPAHRPGRARRRRPARRPRRASDVRTTSSSPVTGMVRARIVRSAASRSGPSSRSSGPLSTSSCRLSVPTTGASTAPSRRPTSASTGRAVGRRPASRRRRCGYGEQRSPGSRRGRRRSVSPSRVDHDVADLAGRRAVAVQQRRPRGSARRRHRCRPAAPSARRRRRRRRCARRAPRRWRRWRRRPAGRGARAGRRPAGCRASRGWARRARCRRRRRRPGLPTPMPSTGRSASVDQLVGQLDAPASTASSPRRPVERQLARGP